MKVIPEKVFVQPSADGTELVVVMEGFRMSLNKSESEALRDGLASGLKKLDQFDDERRRPSPVGIAGDAARMEPRKIGSV